MIHRHPYSSGRTVTNNSFARFLHLLDNVKRGLWQRFDMKKKFNPVRRISNLAVACASLLSAVIAHAETNAIPNPLVDYDTFLVHAADVGRLRAERRVSEEKFIEMSLEPGTVIFDARSDDKYQKLHVQGARHLSFPEITAYELAKLFPDKSTRILIYCNNNFVGDQQAFPTKMVTASLNLSTYIALYTYGYRNVYELGPLLDVDKSKIEFVPAR